MAGLKVAQAVEGIDPLPSKAAVLVEFSRRFLDGWTMSDWKTKQKPTTAMAGGF